MSRIFAGLFVAGALVVVFAILALPAMIASRDTTDEDYKNEMAVWHVSWSDSDTADERRALLSEIDGIRPPTGSVEKLDRHRIYLQPHVIYSEAEDLTIMGLQSTAAELPGDSSNDPLTCANLESTLQLTGITEVGNGGLSWVVEACSLFTSAGKNLVIVRAQASTGWLEDEIRHLEP